jgi:hypothetical protein
MTIRRVGTDDVKVVDWDEPWQRRKAEALAMEQVQRRLALIPGEVTTVTARLWWFVIDVNGIEQTITAVTFVFEQFREHSFSFTVTELFEFETIEQINEAELAWAALQRQRSGIMTAPSADARAA